MKKFLLFLYKILLSSFLGIISIPFGIIAAAIISIGIFIYILIIIPVAVIKTTINTIDNDFTEYSYSKNQDIINADIEEITQADEKE